MGAACGASVWWGHEYGDLVRNKIQSDLTSVITNNYKDESRGSTEIVVDALQRDMQCCGAKSIYDWSLSVYNNNHNKSKHVIGPGNVKSSPFNVPASCCKSNSQHCEVERHNITETNLSKKTQDINTEGCFHKLDIYVKEKWSYLIIIGLILVACQVFALLFTCCLCCAISTSDK